MSQAALDSVALRAQAEHIADIYTPQSYGRPALLEDPDKVHLLLASIRDGNYREVACRQASVSKVCFYNWLKRAEAGDEGAKAFVNALEKAEADAEADMVRNVRNAGKLPQFWAANATYLERKFPDRWGRRPEDSSAPRVVVQVGGSASDVKVLITSGPSPHQETLSALSPTLPMPLTLGDGLGEGPANEPPFARQCLINGDYVNPSGSVPGAVDVPAEPNGGARFAGAGPSVQGAPRPAGFCAEKAVQPRLAEGSGVKARLADRKAAAVLRRAEGRRKAGRAWRAREKEKRASHGTK